MAKRGEQLVAAASRVIHERGAAATTLALVAAEAKVPLGNVYYYFKTKEELVEAVVRARTAELEAFLAYGSSKATPLERLCAIVDAFRSRADDMVRVGCPFGALASELEKTEGGPSARILFSMQLDWMEAQLRELRVPAARARAVELLAAIQGACLVAHALHDAALFKRRLGDLARDLRRELTTES